MSVEAQSIGNCSAGQNSQEMLYKECPPIASMGFWANSEVPLSAGARPMKLAEQQKAVAAHKLPFSQELKVRDNLSQAQQIAEVGDDIRWDLIIQEAAKMSCGLRAPVAAKKVEADDDEIRSTSASGSGSAESDETEEASSLGDDESISRGSSGKTPPWRRDGYQPTSSDRSTTGSSYSPPWRRSAKKEEDARVYSIATMLQCWFVMQQSSMVATTAPSVEEEEEPLEEETAEALAPARPVQAPAAPCRKAPKEAPWRRHAKPAASKKA